MAGNRTPRGPGLTLALLLGVAACAPATEPPSVLLVVVDTLRADHLGTYGYELPTSPSLDAFAQGALVFERAHASSSWTLPSMASLLSGRPPSSHGAGVERDAEGRFLHERGWRDFRALSPAILTLAEAYRARGYVTAGIVTNPFLESKFGLDQGFDHWLHLGSENAGVVLGRAATWFAERPDGPAFTLVHLFDPHLPYDAPEGFAGRFTADDEWRGELPLDKPGAVRRRLAEMTARERSFVTHAYDEEIAYMDHELGRFLTGLEASGALDNTVVVFTSDHGEELFEHGDFEHGHSMYQEVLHVPLIVRGPGITPGRARSPLSLTDVARALFAMSEGRTPAEAFGELDGGGVAFPVEGTLYGADQRAWIDWPAKLIEPQGREALHFDLARDPGEHSPLDLSAEHGRLQAALAERLREAASQAPAEERAQPEAQTLEQLKELGYLGDD